MSKETLLARFRDQGLLPFQADFALQVVTKQPPALLDLRGPVGSGVTHTICHAIAECAINGPQRRILCLVPAVALGRVLRDKISSLVDESAVYFVDRKRLREFQAASLSESDVWPERGVFVSTIDLAKKPDVAPFFVQAKWDLLVVDEAHHLGNHTARMDFVQQLLRSQEMTTVLLGHFQSENLDDLVVSAGQTHSVSTTVWSPEALRDWSGELIGRKALQWQVTHYHMNDNEAAFYEQLQKTAETFDRLLGTDSHFAATLMKRAMSCLYSVERALMDQRNRMKKSRNRLAHTSSSWSKQRTLFDDDVQEVEHSLLDETPNDGNASVQDLEAGISLIDDALRQFEQLETDSKTEALIGVLDGIQGGHACVVSQYAGTILYLQSALEEQMSLKPNVLVGHLDASESQQRISQYRSGGGLLLATDAAIQGVDLPEVETVIHYDLPWNPERLQLRNSRFDRFGRKREVTMIAIVEENAVTARIWEKLLERVTEFEKHEDVINKFFPRDN